MNRRKAILEAAIRLFARKGFHATPTSEVAREAGVAEGTIFHYFRTKEGILMSLIEEIMELYMAGAASVIDHAASGLEALEGLICFHLRFSDEHAERLSVIMRDFPSTLLRKGSPFRERIAKMLRQLMDMLTDCLRKGQNEGSIRPLSVRKTAFLIQGMLIGLSRMKLFGPFHVPEVTQETVDFCRLALSPAEGPKGASRASG